MNAKYFGWALLLLWTLAILTGLWLYNSNQIVSFDPDQRLAQAATSMEFDDRVVAALSKQGIVPGSVVHFQTDDACYCNTLTKSHRDELLRQLEGYHANVLDISGIPELRTLLPTFPAIAVVDKQLQLRYLGPYATGYGCFTGRNLIDNIVSITRSAYHGAVVQTEAEGCFCETRSG